MSWPAIGKLRQLVRGNMSWCRNYGVKLVGFFSSRSTAIDTADYGI
jgi:hypothetical protein